MLPVCALAADPCATAYRSLARGAEQAGEPANAKTVQEALQDLMGREPSLAPRELEGHSARFVDKVQFIQATDTRIRRSFERGPTAVSGKGWFLDNLMTMWRGDVFLEGFARTNERAELPRLPQPWLEYLPAARRFEYRREGAGQRLLQHLRQQHGESIPIGRGLYPSQGQTLQLLRDLRAVDRSIDLAEARRLLAGIRQGLADRRAQVRRDVSAAAEGGAATPAALARAMAPFDKAERALGHGPLEALAGSAEARRKWAEEILEAFFGAGGTERGRTFTTPNLDRARGWNKGAITLHSIPVAELQRLLDRGDIYVGLEHSYVEIYFATPNGVGVLADHLTEMKRARPRE